jgi:hypothetical protein
MFSSSFTVGSGLAGSVVLIFGLSEYKKVENKNLEQSINRISQTRTELVLILF